LKAIKDQTLKLFKVSVQLLNLVIISIRIVKNLFEILTKSKLHRQLLYVNDSESKLLYGTTKLE